MNDILQAYVDKVVPFCGWPEWENGDSRFCCKIGKCDCWYRFLVGGPHTFFLVQPLHDHQVLALFEKHTRENLMKEQFMPSDVFCRLTPNSWRKSGSKNSVDRAKETVDKLLMDHVPKPLPLDAEERLDQVFKEILARHGLPLPPAASKG